MGPQRSTPPASANEAFGEVPGDEVLVCRANAGDDAAFDRLFDRYWERIARYCYYRLGDWADAEDVAQTVMVRVGTELPRFSFRGGPDAFRRWLFTIAHNATVDAARRASRRHEAPFPEVNWFTQPGPSPEDAAILAGTHGWLRDLFAQLAPDQRAVMELRAAGLTNAEIAAVLDKRDDNVRKLVDRARARLDELMRQAGGRHG